MGKLAQKLGGQSQSQIQAKKNGGLIKTPYKGKGSKEECCKCSGGMVKGKK